MIHDRRTRLKKPSEALDAIVVEPPTPEERVRLQYIENDEREDFSDMERAWALQRFR